MEDDKPWGLCFFSGERLMLFDGRTVKPLAELLPITGDCGIVNLEPSTSLPQEGTDEVGDTEEV